MDSGAAAYRARVAWAARGRVLEIGAGSGLNLGLYPPEVSEILALEPDGKLLELAERNAAKAGRRVTFIQGSAEEIPLDDESVDTVVTTWTLCTIPNPDRALAEMHRVLKRDGRLVFAEHGLAPEQSVRKWQNRLTPVWMKVAGGCHLNRPIAELVRHAGFEVDELETGYLPVAADEARRTAAARASGGRRHRLHSGAVGAAPAIRCGVSRSLRRVVGGRVRGMA